MSGELPFGPGPSAPEPDLANAAVDLTPYAAGAPVRLGTSSFSWKDWVGPFYPPGTPPGRYLVEYARQFDTVEVDSTYYGIPRPSMVDGWAAKTPPGFLLSAKFPRSIVHGGEGPRPEGRRVLDPDCTYEERDEFLEVMRRLGPRLGTLVLQFPYFNRRTFPSVGAFLDRLDPFLRDLPRDGTSFAVEVRNKAWVVPDLVECLRRHGVGFVLVDQAWMPHGDEVEARLDVVTGTHLYVRLLGDRQEIEAVTKSWGQEVLDHGERIDRWADVVVRMMRRGIRSLVYANNHYAGHGPSTVRRLRDAILARTRA